VFQSSVSGHPSRRTFDTEHRSGSLQTPNTSLSPFLRPVYIVPLKDPEKSCRVILMTCVFFKLLSILIDILGSLNFREVSDNPDV